MGGMNWNKVAWEDKDRRSTWPGVIPKQDFFNGVGRRDRPSSRGLGPERLWRLAHQPHRTLGPLSPQQVARLLAEWTEAEGVDPDLPKLLAKLRKNGGVPGSVLLGLMADGFDKLSIGGAEILDEYIGVRSRLDSARFVMDSDLARPGRRARKLPPPGH